MTQKMSEKKTFTGNRGLQLEEALIFEIGSYDNCGVDLEDVPPVESRLGACAAQGDIDLPGLSEPEAMRHFVRLSQKITPLMRGFTRSARAP
jgi:glycine dehydrogenase subunit 2